MVLLPAGGTTLALPPWAMTAPTSPLPRCLLAQFSHSRIPPTPIMRLVGEAPGHPPYGHTGRLCPVGSPSELLRSQLVPSSSHCPLQGATSPPKASGVCRCSTKALGACCPTALPTPRRVAIGAATIGLWAPGQRRGASRGETAHPESSFPSQGHGGQCWASDAGLGSKRRTKPLHSGSL